MRQAVLIVMAALFAVLAVVIPALADEAVSVDIPIGTLHGDEGELILVATVETVPGLICVGSVDPVNNSSDHDDTDVVYESGQAGGTIFDVEVPTFDPDQTVSFVTEGPTLIYFRVGPDLVISAGFVAMLDCHSDDETTTTTEPEATTTTVVETTTTVPGETTTTTEPPPIGPVPAGGGAMASQSRVGALVLLGFAGALLLGAGNLAYRGWKKERKN